MEGKDARIRMKEEMRREENRVRERRMLWIERNERKAK